MTALYFSSCHETTLASRFSIARILLTKPCDVLLLATRCCLERGDATSVPSSSDTASISLDLQLLFVSLSLSSPIAITPKFTSSSLAMAHTQPSEVDGDPPGPAIALNRFASSEIPCLEPSWADMREQAHLLAALSEEDQLQETNESPVAHHHCATCTDPACAGPVSAAPGVAADDTSVGLDVYIGRSKHQLTRTHRNAPVQRHFRTPAPQSTMVLISSSASLRKFAT